jgi:sulfite reductase alpha subunit-like flavoprotein
MEAAATALAAGVTNDAVSAPRGRLLILYATETGTAADVAARLARDAATRGFAPELADAATFPPAALPSEPLVV